MQFNNNNNNYYYNSVGLMTGYGLDDRVSIPRSAKISLFSKAFTPVLGTTQPPTQWIPGDISSGIKRPKR
jgi:hypothetical protein